MSTQRQPDWQSEDGAIRLFCGDCLDVLPHIPKDTISAIVTDPPYGINYAGSPGTTNGSSIHTKKAGLRTKEKVVGDDSPFDPAPFIAWPCVFTGAQHFYDRLPRGGSLHSWDKRGDYKRLSFADADIVWCSHKINSQTFRLAWRGLCRHDEFRQKIQHPTQKPVALMKWCMSFVNGEVILDPFMGSGTTGVACIQTGRKFIGIEKEPKYFEIAVGRIKKALREEKEKLQFA